MLCCFNVSSPPLPFLPSPRPCHSPGAPLTRRTALAAIIHQKARTPVAVVVLVKLLDSWAAMMDGALFENEAINLRFLGRESVSPRARESAAIRGGFNLRGFYAPFADRDHGRLGAVDASPLFTRKDDFYFPAASR